MRVGRGVKVGVQVGIGEGFVVGMGIWEKITVAVAVGELAEAAVIIASCSVESIHSVPAARMINRHRVVTMVNGAEGRFPVDMVQVSLSEFPQLIRQFLWSVCVNRHV
jgi:hypothetical protein